jgi:amino acid adenylation domain-containing protein
LIEDIYTLSPLQQGMLFHALHSPESGAYVVQTCIRFGAGLGPAERAALTQSWQQVVDRHPVLRTAFEWLELDEPVQVVYAPFPLTWEHHDWRGLPAAEQAERLAEHLRIDRRRGFDLSTPPLLRLALIQLGEEEAETCQLVWTHHHAILDGWSLPILLRELFSCYAAASSGRPAVLPPARPYRDFIAWLNGQSLADAEAFWRAELAGFVAPAPLPGAGAEDGLARQPAVQQTLLGAAASDALGAFARRHQLTQNTLAQGAWALLLARAGGQDDVVFGTVTAGRGAPVEGIETMVGLLINTLPVRVRVPQGTPAVAWLRRLQEAQFAARQFEHTPLPKVRAWSEVPTGAALFDSILAFENYPLDEALRQDAATAVVIAGVDGSEQTHYPLTLNVQPGSRWLLRLAATDPRLDAVSVARLLGSLEALLLGLIREDLAAVPVAELPALAAAERQQLLIELPAEPGGALTAESEAWLHEPGQAARDLDGGRLVHELFTAQARRAPERPALTCEGVTLTYGVLDQRANRLAARLAELGAGPDALVAVCLPRSLDLVVAILAVLKAGAAYLPLDPGYPEEHLAWVLADAGARLLVATSEIGEIAGIAAAAAELPVQIPLVKVDDRAEGPPRGPRRFPQPSNLAYVIYTSGSTGRPKGVAVTHANAARLLGTAAQHFDFRPDDTWTLFHSCAFDFSVWEIWGALAFGGRLVVVPFVVSRTPQAFAALLGAERVTVLNQTPSAFAQLSAHLTAHGESLPSLRWVIFGGEKLEPALVRGWLETPGSATRLVNMYGITETTVHVTWHELRAADLDRARSASSPIDPARSAASPIDPGRSAGSPIGLPLADLTVDLLDRDGRPAAPDAPGEMYVGGAGLARGYLGRPELTAERFVPDPWSGMRGTPGARLYKSGDLAFRRAGGGLDYVGRADGQVKVRGFRIEPGEIEAALLAAPQVAEAAVVVREPAPGDRRLAAYVVPREPAPAGLAALLRTGLRGRLPEHMVPATVTLLAAMPLTANGKTDRRALAALDPGEETLKAAPATAAMTAGAAGAGAAANAGFVAPRNPAEELMADIWCQVLGTRRVGAMDDFFDLGGDSILSLQVVSRAARAGWRISPRDLFDHPTVAGLAAVATAATPSDLAAQPAPPLVRAPRDRPLPLSFAQERLWFLDRLEPGSAAYNILLAQRVHGALRAPDCAAALATLVCRHEALRTTFLEASDGRPVLKIAPPEDGTLPLAVVELSSLPSGRAEAEALRLAAAVVARPFDLARGPLLRAALVRLDDTGSAHVFLLCLHHAIADGWSLALLVREIAELLTPEAPETARAVRPEPPFQYADFALWQRQSLGRQFARDLEHWRALLADVPLHLELPADRPRPRQAAAATPGAAPAVSAAETDGVRNDAAGHYATVLPAAAVTRLGEVARSASVTPFMLQLAAFQVLLHRLTGRERLIVGTPVANRLQPEVEGIVGLFVNLLALPADLRDDPPLPELLARVREVTLGTFTHSQLPFEKLVEALQPERSLQQEPVVQVMLTLQNATRPGFAAAGAGRVETPGLRFEPLPVGAAELGLDLLLDLAEAPHGLAATWVYRSRLFEPATVARWARGYANLLDAMAAAMAAAPDSPPISALDMLAPEERHQVLVEWSRGLRFPAAEREVGGEGGGGVGDVGGGVRFVHQLVELHAALRPTAEAVVWPGEENAERLTYGELNARANRLARHLRRLGVGPEVRVALWLPRSADLVVAVLAVLKAGGCYVPLDAAYSGERLAFMAADAQARVLVTRGEAAGGAPAAGGEAGDSGDSGARGEIGKNRSIVVRLDDPALAAALAASSDTDLPPAEAGIDPDNLAYVIYTSGSTGRPKGTMIAHGGLLNAYHAYERAYRLDRVTGHLQMASFSFDVFTGDFIRALGSGARLVLCPREVLLDAERLYGLLRTERIDGAEFVPAVVRALVGHLERVGASDALERVGAGDALERVGAADALQRVGPAPADTSLDFMRLLVVSSDAWYAGEVAALARLCGPHTRLIDSYGVTEATIDSTFLALAAGDGTPCLPVPAAAAVVPIGRPLAGNEAWVLGTGADLLPVRSTGELCIGGAGVARGYLGRPELTAERFVPHPFATEPGARLYRAGDLARWLPDGNVEFLGRADSQIKVRGFRIEPGEIEAALGAHPQVSQAVVLALAGDTATADRHLVAYVVPAATPETPETNEFDEKALRAFLKQRLPDYMVPALIVPLAALPLTPNGKVDRRALPAPDRNRSATGSEADRHRPPRTAVETTLAAIWREVLRVEAVGAGDDFFAVGGHSLVATQVLSRLRGAFGIEMPLRDLFEAPVLADLAARIETAQRALRSGETAPAAATLPPPPIIPIAPILRQGPLPLSFAQQRLWFIDQLEPGSPLYNVPVALGVEGPLDAAVLARCLGEIERRHEALRTVFAVRDGAPVQVIRPAAPFRLGVVDLSGLPSSRQEAQARALVGREAARPFDLAAGPLLRGTLLRQADETHVAALTVHHIASDDWSMGILVREIVALYPAFAAGLPSPLPELPVQYADFAAWQHSWLHGEVLAGEIAWWRRQLAGLPPLLELPTDRPRPAVQSYRGATRPVRLPAAVTRQAEALARREGATLFMVLLAAFQALLGRISGQDDLAVGSPIAGRNRVETEELIGFFVNTLVLRGDLTGEPTFRQLLGRVRETALAANLHQDVPFEKLVQELAPARSLAHAPLFQVMFTWQTAPAQSLAIPGLRLRQVAGAGTTAKFDLLLALMESDGALSGVVEHATDLFDGTTVERLLASFARLLAAAVAAPDEPAAALPLLGPDERHQITVEWNDSAMVASVASPGTASVYDLFRNQARLTPAAVAAVCGDTALTYAGLAARAARLARRLRREGIGPDVPVGLMVERSLDMVVGVLGILQAGAAYVSLDPDYPAQRLAFMLDDARSPVLLTRAHLRHRLPAASARVLLLDDDVGAGGSGGGKPGGGGGGFPAAWDAAVRGGAPAAENLAYVIFTSGSTGRPKGVAVSHGALLNLIDWHLRACLGGARTLQFASLSFDVSFYEMFACWGSGGTLVVAPEEHRRDMTALADLLARQRIEKAILPVVVLQQLASIFAGRRELPPLREIVATGERLQTNRAMAELLRHLPGCTFHNHYGPSETAVEATAFTLGREPRDWPLYPPIGRPIGNSTAYVLDPGLTPAPIGVPGELYLGGACLARGYLGRPDLTAQRFVPDPCGREPGARLYRTGDKVRLLAQGDLEFLGRFDDQVKIRGFRVELGEIEAVLLSLPGVREAAVVVRDDVGAGDPGGQRRLVAYVVTDAADALALRQPLHRLLPDYMVPAAFVTLAALPLNANRKVDRKALPAPQRQGSPAERLAPRTPCEEALAGIWAEVLGVERVGANDHFFELGGHSLLATRVMSRVRATFDVEMPLRDLFASPRLADLAARIDALRRAGTPETTTAMPPLVPVPRQGTLPLSFAQQRLWLIDQLEPGSSLYNLPAVLRVEGPLSRAVLARCFGEIVRRHEALRTVFAVFAGGQGSPAQVIRPAAPVALPVVDLAGLPASRREPLALALTSEETARPFDLARGPLLRGVLLRLAAGGEAADHVAVLTLHHIASDGWSTGILVREIAALYQAFAAGRPSPLPELAVQYADFAAWQRSWLHGEVLEREVAYWRRQLAGLPPLLALPADRPRPARQTFRGASRPLRLPAALRRQAEALARREGATLFMVLLTVFQALLARLSGQHDLAVGSPVAARNRVEIEGLIGFFVNTLVLRGGIPADMADTSLRAQLARVRETALAAYLHQDVPFEKLVEDLAPGRSLAHAPLFQVMFALQSNAGFGLEIRDLRLRPVTAGGALGTAGAAGTAAKFDLTLTWVEQAGELAGELNCATDLFDGATIDRLAGYCERLAAAAVAAADRPLADLPLLSPAELHQARSEWNPAASAAGAAPASVVARFERWAARTPHATAVVAAEETLTYADLDARANRLARRLRSLGVTTDGRVGLCAERSAAMIAAVLGILKAGAAYVPLDPAYPRERLAFMVEDARLPVLVAEERLLGFLPQTTAATLLLPPIDEDGEGGEGGDGKAGDGQAGASGERLPEAVATPDSLAYMLYTSGSTGRPKGVMLHHRGWSNLAEAQRYLFGLGPGDRVMQFASLNFDASAWEISMALGAGATLVLGPRERRLSREELTAVLAECTAVLLPPTVLATLSPQDLPGLKTLIVGGEACPVELARQFAGGAAGAAGAAGRRLWNAYGPTEATVVATTHLYGGGDRLPIGRPIEGTEAWVLDAWGNPAPVGVAGELCLGGRGLARGYWNQPEQTARSFVPHPLAASPGERLYRTGDLAVRRPDGSLEYLGRLDHQVKIRGFRIELGEIEAALAALPGVRAAAVTVREDRSPAGAGDPGHPGDPGAPGDPGERRLVAYVAADAAAAPALRQALAGQLPEHMVPAAFVILAALPLLPNGKVDRKALPAPERQRSAETWVAPEGPVEEVLAGIWAEVLGVERVGAADHFFDLGGHSLLGTQVMSRLRGAFGVELPLRALFEAQTLAGLAAGVEAALRAGAAELPPPIASVASVAPLAPELRQGPLPLSFAQQRLWFIDQLEPGSPLYNIPMALRVEGPLGRDLLALCLTEIVRRHEALRTVFAMHAGSPVQAIRPAAPLALPLVDLSGLPAAAREPLALALAGEEAGRPFDLARGPLLRGLLLRLGPGDHLAALTLHHIAGDGWSMGILVPEVAALYAAFAAGRPSPLPELPVQYADFAVWQRSWLQGEALDAEVDFWRRQLTGLPPLLALPTDRPRPAVQSFRGAVRPVRLPAGLTRQVEALARREGATLFMVLLAAFQALLARTSGQLDLAVGSPIAGRNRVEIEGLIGFFVNTLVLRGDLSGHRLSFQELLARVRETSLAAYMHQDVPFEKLVEELAPERSLTHTPLFQAMLVLQNAPAGRLAIRDLRLRPVAVPATTAKFDLTLTLEAHAGELAGGLEHSTDLFDAATMDRFLGRFERLLRAAAEAPEEPFSALPLLGPEEHAQVLREWNDTASAAAGTAIYELFAAQARRTPDAVAMVFGDAALTYAGLAARASRLARRLRRLGVGPDVHVGVLVERSVDMIVGVLGILQAGGAYVPLDPQYPTPRLAFMLDDTSAPVLLTQQALADLLPTGSAHRLLLDGGGDGIAGVDGSAYGAGSACGAGIAGAEGIAYGEGSDLAGRVNLADLADLEEGSPALGDNLGYVIYTSGSTGRPKGVALSQWALRNLIDWHLSTMLGGARTLQFASLSFDASFHEMFACWGSGGTLVVVPEELRRDPPALGRLLVGQQVEKAILPVVVLQQLAEVFAGGEALPPLRELTTTGERLQTNRAMAALLQRLPGCTFHNHYGPSETHVVTAFTLSPEVEEWRVYPPIGRPIGNSTAYVLEPDLTPAPIGVFGDLHLGGACLARGYLGRPDLTAQRFVPDPCSGEPGARLYRTGDKVRALPNGDLELVGRFDDQVKIRGFRVEPGEIEALLLTLAGVREAVVVVREERSDRRLVAYVVGDTAADALRRALRDKLPDHMVPSAFVVLAELPLTPNGKVDRRALPAPEPFDVGGPRGQLGAAAHAGRGGHRRYLGRGARPGTSGGGRQLLRPRRPLAAGDAGGVAPARRLRGRAAAAGAVRTADRGGAGRGDRGGPARRSGGAGGPCRAAAAGRGAPAGAAAALLRPGAPLVPRPHRTGRAHLQHAQRGRARRPPGRRRARRGAARPDGAPRSPAHRLPGGGRRAPPARPAGAGRRPAGRRSRRAAGRRAPRRGRAARRGARPAPLRPRPRPAARGGAAAAGARPPPPPDGGAPRGLRRLVAAPPGA